MTENGVQLVCFKLCGQTYAFDMKYLIEIVQVPETELTPCFAPLPLIRSQWQYRDQTIYILDLRDAFGLEEQGASDQPEDQAAAPRKLSRAGVKTVLVVSIQAQPFGLLTDGVLQVVPLEPFYEYPTMISLLPQRYFAGLTLVNHELILILAIDKFITNHEFATLTQTGEQTG
jgi:chemotaxis signal transduction protein